MRKNKLLDKAKNNPDGLRFSEFERLMRGCGWTERRQRGSHRIWYSPRGYRLSVQPSGNMAKGYQVRQFLERYEEEVSNGEE